MRGYDVSFDEPAMNLALDEALLNLAETGEHGPCLRIWESPVYFVVLGVSQRASHEVKLDDCSRDGIPVARRCSAGGCVLQGPGCLNYSLVLDSHSDPALSTIRASYCSILTRIRDSLMKIGILARLEGTSDLAVGGFKFSGNAQRRKKRHLLHHGTVLYDFRIEHLARYLREPSDRPAYRGEREHGRFVRNIDRTREEVVSALTTAFDAAPVANQVEHAVSLTAEALCSEKYVRDTWTYRR